MVDKKGIIKSFLEGISKNCLKWMQDGIFRYSQKSIYEIAGEIIEQVNYILKGDPAKSVWQNYHDSFIQITVIGLGFSPGKLLREVFLDHKTLFQKSLFDITSDLKLPYFRFLDFIRLYFQLNEKLEFNEKLYNSLYEEFKEIFNDRAEKKYSYTFKIPLLNFIFEGINHKEEIFTIRLIDLNEDETPIYSLPNLTENEIPPAFDPTNSKFLPPLLDSRFVIDGKNTLAGILAPYLFEININYSNNEAGEISKYISDLQSELINENLNYYEVESKFIEYISKKTKEGNSFAKIEFFQRYLKRYIEHSFHIFKLGDFRIFNLLHGHYPELKYIFDSPLASLEEDFLPDFNFPYELDEDEIKDFFIFFKKFLNLDFKKQPIFFRAVEKFNSTIYEGFKEEVYFDYYLTLEILIASDFKSSSGKASAIKKRVNFLLKNSSKYRGFTEVIIDCLRRLRNDIAHKGSISKNNFKNLTNLFLRMFPEIELNINALIKELQEFIRYIIWNFWLLFEQCSFDEVSTLSRIYKIK